MQIDATLVTTVLGFLTACIGGGRYLMGYYFRKLEENEKLKFALTEKSIEAIQLMMDNHKIILKTHTEKIEKHSQQMTEMMGREEKTREAFGRIAGSMKEYIDSTKLRMAKLESAMIDVTSDIKIIKGAKNAKRTN